MELDPVVESFEADVSNFVNNIELAIEASRHFRDEVLADVEAIRAAIDTLPEERVIHVRVDYDNAAPEAAPVFGAPDTGATADVFRSFDDILAEYEEMQGRAGAATEQAAVEFESQAEALRAARDATQDLADADITAAEVEKLLADATRARDSADLAALNSAHALKNATDDLTNSTNDSALAAGHAVSVGRILTREYALFGGVLGDATLIGKIAGWHIALDGLLEASIALGEGLSALSVGLAAMVPAGEDIYTHLASVSDVSNALGVTIPPLTGKFQALGQAMAPRTVEAYGGALALLAGNGSVVARVAQEVVTGLDDWIAKLDLFDQANGTSGKFLQDGVGFLHQFEEAVDNVGDALHNMMAADPGTAHFLMDFVVLGTDALRVITELPAPVLEAALAFHSFMLWGGLAATQALKLLNPLRAVALGMGEVTEADVALTDATAEQGGMSALKATLSDIGAGFASWAGNIRTAVTDAEGLDKVGSGLGSAFSFVNPVAAGVAVLAAGIGFLTYEMLQSSQASQQFGAAVSQALNQSSATQFLTQYPQLVAQGSAQLQVALGQQVDAWKSYNIATHNTVEDLKNADFPGVFENAGKAVGDFFSAAVHGQQAQNSIDNYTGALANLDAGQKRILQDADGLISKGSSLAQSFALLDLAGVTASDSLAVADQKVKNLIQGYQAMSVQGNLLAGATNAVTFAAEQQQSKVSALTQAYSTWFSTITGGESTFNSFAQQVIGLYQSMDSSGLKVTDANGKVSTSLQLLASGADSTNVSMTGLNSASLNAQNTFIQSASSAQDNFNSLLTLASAAGLGQKGTQMLTGAMNDYMAALIPAAGSNKALQQSLVSMYQEVNPNVTSFGQLEKTVGNVKNPIQSLQSTTTAFTLAAGNLATDVNNLANAIGQNLNQAMAQAILQANGGQTAFDNFATAALNAHGNTKQMTDSAFTLAEKLIQVTGNTKTAEGEFVTFAGEMGISKSAAQQLWNQVESGAANADSAVTTHANHIIAELNSIPNTKNIEFVISTAGSTGAVSAGPVKAAAEGWHVPGYGGGDTVPAMLEPGEAVVPKHLVSGVAPYLAAHHVPGFAAGGKVGTWDMADVFALWGKEMWSHDLKGHGAGHPIAEAAMKALLASVTQPKKLSGIWDNPAWRDYAKDLKADMAGYSGKDLEYWSLMAAIHPAMTKARKAEIEHLEHEEHLHTLNHEPGWVKYYEKKLYALEHPETAKDAAELAMLKREGFASGGLVRSYDSGGYLPVGLSMAYNGTGRPEAVGGGGAPEVHVHLHGDLADDTIWDRMQAKTLDYGYNNTGRPTGVWQPGG